MIRTIFILGRQPILGLAELESKYGVEKLEAFSDNIAISSDEVSARDLDYVGGTIKIAESIFQSPKLSWPEIEKDIIKNIVPRLIELPDGKIDFGISCYGLNVNPRQIMGFCLAIKKLVKASGRSIRVVPNQTPELSSAQVIHNKLHHPTGFELLICVSKNSVLLGRTVAIQDIEAYAKRDQTRPKRDAKVGMLPPKLAQIMINLANPAPSSIILDPFCGTGVILQEALIAGHEVVGTDLNPKMVDYSRTNLNWLEDQYGKLPNWQVEVGDATKYRWPAEIATVVSETYLGNPLFKLPSNYELKQEASEIGNLIRNFLVNLASQLKPGTRICIAVPAWYLGDSYFQLPILDLLEEIGYNHMSFKTVDTNALIYHRPAQIVARQLLVLIRK
jgi:tRNA (guanine10-N2)-dimethyltransferase